MTEQGNPIAEAVEEVAGDRLGVERWDRPAIFRDTADAASDNGLPYWMVLVLSGAIATLGLAMNSSAVVIGAMLVAPLLAPVVGLGLALAVGDGRLAVQTGAVVLGSTVAVVLVGWALTALLPFHTVTVEISARVRPTTLDLAIAVFSGLVGAVVTVARGSRLSAAIPGVAISVALIPPLAVAGFGLGIGRWDLVRGSMLLYSANLAGIVLSGMTVFLLVGMHRADVVDSARRWHREGSIHGLAEWMDRVGWVRSLGVFRSVAARVGLVLAFAVALGIPLSESLGQIARETRVERSVGETADRLFAIPGRASVLGRQVVIGEGRTQVYLRVATTQWFGAEEREDFEREASALAGEPVRLSLEQLPARGEDLDQLAALLPGQEARPVQPPPPPAPTSLAALIQASRTRLAQALEAVVLPAGTEVVGVALTTAGTGAAVLRVTYLAPEPLATQAQEILRGQLRRAADLADLDVRFAHLAADVTPLSGGAQDSARIAEVAALLQANEGLAVELVGPPADADRAVLREAAERLRQRGVDPDRVTFGTAAVPALRLRPRDADAASTPPADGG